MPRLKVIMTTCLLDAGTMVESRLAWADGYLIKPVCPLQFLAWITFLSGTQPHTGVERTPADKYYGSAGNSQNHALLNSRENVVAHLVSKGYRDKEIADQLRLSVCVVGNLVKNIRHKLEASNRAEVASRLHLDTDRFKHV